MSWSAPDSAPSYYPSTHGRRFWRHCVQTLFNHNRLDVAKWKSNELVEGSSGRSVPSGLCDACIGIGGPDEEGAFHWFRAAAEAGLTDAMYQLGQCYLHGTGVEQDMVKAYFWLDKVNPKSRSPA